MKNFKIILIMALSTTIGVSSSHTPIEITNQSLNNNLVENDTLLAIQLINTMQDAVDFDTTIQELINKQNNFVNKIQDEIEKIQKQEDKLQKNIAKLTDNINTLAHRKHQSQEKIQQRQESINKKQQKLNQDFAELKNDKDALLSQVNRIIVLQKLQVKNRLIFEHALDSYITQLGKFYTAPGFIYGTTYGISSHFDTKTPITPETYDLLITTLKNALREFRKNEMKSFDTKNELTNVDDIEITLDLIQENSITQKKVKLIDIINYIENVPTWNKTALRIKHLAAGAAAGSGAYMLYNYNQGNDITSLKPLQQLKSSIEVAAQHGLDTIEVAAQHGLDTIKNFTYSTPKSSDVVLSSQFINALQNRDPKLAQEWLTAALKSDTTKELLKQDML